MSLSLCPPHCPRQWTFNKLLVPLALETPILARAMKPGFSYRGMRADAPYLFEVLPAGALPSQENGAEWASIQIACCALHSITSSAAARDRETIAGHARQVAEEFVRCDRAAFPVGKATGSGMYSTSS